jgi:hypothetical protein
MVLMFETWTATNCTSFVGGNRRQSTRSVDAHQSVARERLAVPPLNFGGYASPTQIQGMVS